MSVAITNGADITLSGDISAAGGYRQTIDQWFQENVAASQTAVVLARWTSGGTGFPTKWIAPRAGSVTGIVVKSSAARVGGTLTVEVYVDGVATGLQAILNGTDTTVKSSTQAKDTDLFTAGAAVDVRITTDGSWSPTTADIAVSIEVET